MADEEVEKAAEASQEDEAASGGRSRLILIAAAAVLVLAGAGAWFVLLGGSGSGDAEEAIESCAAEASAEGEAAHPFERAQREATHEVASGGTEDKATGKQLMGEIFSLDTFVVNIGDGDRDRYLKLKVELELSKDLVSDELQQRLPQIRDLMISLLGSKSFDDVRSIEGKNLLREEMLQRINALLLTGTARSIFFTEFVVQ